MCLCKTTHTDACPEASVFGGTWSDKPLTLTYRDSRLQGVWAPVSSVLPYSGPLSYRFPVFSCHLFASDGTEAISEEQLLSCGARDCLTATASTNSTQRPSQTLISTLLGIYAGTCSPRAESLQKKSVFPKYKHSCKMSSAGSSSVLQMEPKTAERAVLQFPTTIGSFFFCKVQYSSQ